MPIPMVYTTTELTTLTFTIVGRSEIDSILAHFVGILRRARGESVTRIFAVRTLVQRLSHINALVS